MKTALLKTEDLVEGYNPRKNFEISELKNSIQNYGVLVPLLVRPKDGKYEIVSGERRWRACKELGLSEIPCYVKEELTDEQVFTMSFIENKERNNLTVLEISHHLVFTKKKFDYSLQMLADKNGMSGKSLVSEYLSIARLPEDPVFSRLNSMQSLYSLSKLSAKDDEELSEEDIQKRKAAQSMIAIATFENDWTVKRVEKEVQKALKRLVPAKLKKQDPSSQVTKSIQQGIKRLSVAFASLKEGIEEFSNDTTSLSNDLLAKIPEKKKSVLLSELDSLEGSKLDIDLLKTAIKRLKTGIQGDLELKD